MRIAAGFDIGGTKIAGGVVRDDGRVLHCERRSTPSLSDGDSIFAIVREMLDDFKLRFPAIEGAGIGAAGMVDWPSGNIRYAPNNGYRNFPLARLLSDRTGWPVIVENDANAAAFAEARFGSGRGLKCTVTLTVGTGIGGGLVLDGALFRGASGVGGELGHIIVNASGPRCGCGAHGCLEAMASGVSLARAGQKLAQLEPEGRLAVTAQGRAVTAEVVFAAARLGDPSAVALRREFEYWLGVGVATITNVFDPEMVVFAGGISAALGTDLLTSVANTTQEFVFGSNYRELPKFALAELGADAGLVGAAGLVLHGRLVV